MRFIIGGQGFDIDRETILAATSGVEPKPFDGRNRYFVELHGLRFPIKQVIHLVTGLSYTADFTAQYAHHILKKLGFAIETLPVPGLSAKSAVTARTVAPNIEGATRFVITLEPDEDGYIVAGCPALPGCYSQGRNEAEAIRNVKEAIRGYVASMRRHGEPVPVAKDVRQIEVLV